MLLALQKYPQLSDFCGVTKKAVMTERDREVLGDLLSNARRLDDAKSALLSSEETAYSEENELARVLWVQYLRLAMAWDDNPAIKGAVAVARDVFLADNLRVTLPQDLRKSLAGDKIELFATIKSRFPNVAAEIQQEAGANHPSSKLIAFVLQREAFSAEQLQ